MNNYNIYYDILNINYDADLYTIKKAYRQLSLKYHPDKNQNNPDASEKFSKINEAFSYLTNKDGEQDEEFGFPFQTFQTNLNGNGKFEQMNINPNDIFNMMFGNNNIFDTLPNIKNNNLLLDIYKSIISFVKFDILKSSKFDGLYFFTKELYIYYFYY